MSTLNINDLLLLKIGSVGKSLRQGIEFQKRAQDFESQLMHNDYEESEDLSPDELLVNAMKEQEEYAPEKHTVDNPQVLSKRRPSDAHGTSTSFYHEDETLPLGPTFTLMPPYTQI